jgi:2-C-methyl-D-erythritol 4-phosphate cytidylyltransferase
MYLIQNYSIIVAAGKGLRMGSKLKKQYLHLEGIPILARTIMAFDNCDQINEIILVIPKIDHDYCKKHIIDPFDFVKKIYLVEGGNKRQDSVLNGLNCVHDIMSLNKEVKEVIVLIHDGVRPFVNHNMIEDCIQNAIAYGACIPAVKITDTVKQLGCDLSIQKTINRQFLYAAQTPQTFKIELILRAFEHARKTGFSGTDDASLVEHLGDKVVVAKGSNLNIKITTKQDLVLGKFLLNNVKV